MVPAPKNIQPMAGVTALTIDRVKRQEFNDIPNLPWSHECACYKLPDRLDKPVPGLDPAEDCG